MNKNIIFGLCLLTTSLFANDELSLYTLKKLNIPYAKLDKNQQIKIKSEYQQLLKVNNHIKKNIIDNSSYKVLENMMVYELWSKQFKKNYNPSEKVVREIFEKNKPQLRARYKIRNIIVKYESSANKIIKKLKKENDKLKAFIKFVNNYSTDFRTNSKGGDFGWVSSQQIAQSIKDKLSNKKIHDVVKINLNNKGWEIVFIEDIKPSRMATYQEAKQFIVEDLKNRALELEIKKILAK